jgi:DNA mismatch repair protein MutS2
VDTDALAVLEYPRIVERLAAAAATVYGEELARALVPASQAPEVERRQAVTTEAIALLDAAAEPSLAGIDDVRPAAARAARGATLAPAELRDIAVAITVALDARRRALDADVDVPLLRAHAARIEPGLAELRQAIVRRVEEDGSGLRDDASPALRRLRRELRDGAQRVREHLARTARSEELREALQETFVTERNGRPVLAVKAGARRAVPGIVHGASSSGQTLFVEPFAVVELGNRRAEAASAEREEVERILRELSTQTAPHAGALVALVEATGALDLALACATVSRGFGGAPVRVGDDVRLLTARHPLLDARTAVPIDLDLDRLRALVVSGPNTGGKTVALKTLGLAALLHQAGLRPPAREAALPVFDAVLADIGDSQSIEMSLSTFSGHLRTIVAILNAATERSLVLLDELAAGTDPVEGSALAQALVARLAGQARLTVVTTHYPELKEWASVTAGVANAATGFDPDTHAPLYRVALGRPGTSHALHIAERLGLDAAVVADARGRVAPDRLRAAELVAEAEAAERAAAAARAAAEEALAESAERVESLREREHALEAEIASVRAQSARQREAAVAEAERELADARAELRALREEIRVARRRERERRRAAPAAAERAEADRDRRLGAAAERSARAERAIAGTRRPLPVLAPLQVGDPVEAPGFGVRGTIVEIDGDEAVVVAPSGARVRLPLARLHPDASRPTPAAASEPVVRVVAGVRGDVSDELDVRGMRADEARHAARAFVDDAALAGLRSVRVVHGRGTGAVRAAVRDELSRHSLVERHEPDSGDGATVAQLG